jgi:hypothetical protein
VYNPEYDYSAELEPIRPGNAIRPDGAAFSPVQLQKPTGQTGYKHSVRFYLRYSGKTLMVKNCPIFCEENHHKNNNFPNLLISK